MRIDQPHTWEWLKFSDALRVDWRILDAPKPHTVFNYMWETPIWAVSVSEQTTLQRPNYCKKTQKMIFLKSHVTVW